MQEPPVLHAPIPGTDKLLEVERIIREATWNGESPISLNEIKRRMAQKAPRHSQVRDLVNLLLYLGRISEFPEGVEYTYMDPEFAAQLDTVPL